MSNVVLNPGVGGSTLGTDQVGGIDYQLVKLAYSVSGIAPTQVSASAPLPVTDASVVTALGTPLQAGGTVAVSNFPASVEVSNDVGNPLPVSGTVTANQGAPPWTWDLVKVNGVATSLGQKAMAASLPVVLASDQASIPVTASAGTNLNTSALLLDATFTTRINTQGQKAMAASTPVVIASDQSAVPISGTVTTTPPANASSNVAQFGGTNVVTGIGASGAGIPRVTVSSDSFPAFVLDATFTGRINTLGQKAMAASTPVVLASDQTSIPVAATQSGAPWAENVTQFGGVNLSTGTGISGTGIPRVTVSSDSFPATQAVSGTVAISGTVPVSAVALPLPSGAAQESGNLATIQFALQRLIDLQTQMLAVLQAMHAQDGNLTGQPVDPSNFLSEQYLQ